MKKSFVMNGLRSCSCASYMKNCRSATAPRVRTTTRCAHLLPSYTRTYWRKRRYDRLLWKLTCAGQGLPHRGCIVTYFLIDEFVLTSLRCRSTSIGMCESKCKCALTWVQLKVHACLLILLVLSLQRPLKHKACCYMSTLNLVQFFSRASSI